MVACLLGVVFKVLRRQKDISTKLLIVSQFMITQHLLSNNCLSLLSGLPY